MRATEGAQGNRRIVALAAAIVAVFAALGTLFSHHRSIGALSAKNQAILVQSRATDTFNLYEAKQIRSNIYRALLSSDLVRDAKNRTRLGSIAAKEEASSKDVLAKAKDLEAQASLEDERSESILRSYETLLFATTLFEFSIVLISIAALAHARLFLPLAAGLSVIGLAFFFVGLLRR
ncbi:MAG TPA: DUF4337 family protein [Candidatus Cybelea sp.]|jgi:hypothetical protein|nr:DUF4337 family protein [Candidatus Cybelea sp.]